MIYNHFQTYNLTFFRIGNDLLFVNESTGTIDTRGVMEGWEKAEIDHLPDWWNEISDLLNPLVGWAVCFKRDEVKYSVAEIRSAWELRTKETKDQKGRPRIQERVSLAYREKFPHGHVGETWKHVQTLYLKGRSDARQRATAKAQKRYIETRKRMDNADADLPDEIGVIRSLLRSRDADKP